MATRSPRLEQQPACCCNMDSRIRLWRPFRVPGHSGDAATDAGS